MIVVLDMGVSLSELLGSIIGVVVLVTVVSPITMIVVVDVGVSLSEASPPSRLTTGVWMGL